MYFTQENFDTDTKYPQSIATDYLVNVFWKQKYWGDELFFVEPVRRKIIIAASFMGICRCVTYVWRAFMDRGISFDRLVIEAPVNRNKSSPLRTTCHLLIELATINDNNHTRVEFGKIDKHGLPKHRKDVV